MGGKKWLSSLAGTVVLAGNESTFDVVQVPVCFLYPFFVLFLLLCAWGYPPCAALSHVRWRLPFFQVEGDGASPANFLADGSVAEDDAREVAAADTQKRVMCLMSDTGGGHRASAQALRDGFEALYGASQRGATSL